MAGFLFRLETVDGEPAEPPTLSSAVPDWKPSENKFKCPCHGSGYDSEGVNFEGPAPRPMDRAKVEIAPDGQILVDVSKLYQWPKGQPSAFNDPGAFLPT